MTEDPTPGKKAAEGRPGQPPGEASPTRIDGHIAVPPLHAEGEARSRGGLGLLVWLIVLSVAGYFGWQAYQGHVAGQAKAGGTGRDTLARSVPVNVALARKETVPTQITAIGNVLPYQTVSITSLVGGKLLNIYFKQGDFVKQGQTLFQIDPGPFQAAVDQLRANVAKDRANVLQGLAVVEKDKALVRQAQDNMKRDIAQQVFNTAEDKRYGSLLHTGYVTAEQAEQFHATAGSGDAVVQADRSAIASARAAQASDAATVVSLQAAVKSDEASERNAELQLSYTTIKSPLSGRTGSFTLYEGAIVTANSTTPLITIDEIEPIYVTFAIPEQYLNDIRKQQSNGALGVEASIADNNPAPEKDGRITFIDQTVDTSTGTITLRGTFPNRAHRLWPGRFTNLTLRLAAQNNATVVPVQAVQPGQKGDYLYVVKDDNTVENRDVKVDRTWNDIAVIASGVQAGERIVTDGQLTLVPGAKVEIVEPTRPGGKIGSGHHKPPSGAGESPSPEASQSGTQPAASAAASPAGSPSAGSPAAGAQTPEAEASGKPAAAESPAPEGSASPTAGGHHHGHHRHGASPSPGESPAPAGN